MEKPPMYRSIHSGTCPPTGSTFCPNSNAYNCGIYNLGGRTDGALDYPHLVQPSCDPARDASRLLTRTSGCVQRNRPSASRTSLTN